MEKNAAVTNLPGAFYFSDYLWKDAPQEQQKLFDYCTQLPKTKRGYISGNSGTNLIPFFALFHSQDQRSLYLATMSLSPRISAISSKNSSSGSSLTIILFRFLLMNIPLVTFSPFLLLFAYLSDDRMIPHKDGLGHFGAIVSLGSTSILDFYYKPAEFVLSSNDCNCSCVRI